MVDQIPTSILDVKQNVFNSFGDDQLWLGQENEEEKAVKISAELEEDFKQLLVGLLKE